MKFPCKDGEAEIDPLWVKEWCEVYYADDVEMAIHKARLWCLDNDGRRKTVRGLRRFLGAWIRRDCRLRPKESKVTNIERDPQPRVERAFLDDQLRRMKEALK